MAQHIYRRADSAGPNQTAPYDTIQALLSQKGWSGGVMVLGKLPVPGHPTILMIVGQGPIALEVGAGWGCLDIFTLLYLFSSLSPSLRETARYRLKYCLKGLLNPNQPTNCLRIYTKKKKKCAMSNSLIYMIDISGLKMTRVPVFGIQY